MYILELSDITKRFKKTAALDSVSLQIKKGEIFGLLGPNGAGKTTLISIISGLMLPDCGKIIFDGEVVRSKSQIDQKINVVRGFSGVIDKLTVGQLLKYYALLYGVRSDKIKEVMRRTGLEEKKNVAASELSSGWRQKFFIAKALLNDPVLLLLDEPTVGLDVQTARDVRKLIVELKKTCTIILTTHYMKEAEELCDRIGIINNGRIVYTDTPSKLKKIIHTHETITISGQLTKKDINIVSSLSCFEKYVLGHETLRCSIKKGFDSLDALRNVMDVVVKNNIVVSAIEIEEPAFEDVFLQLMEAKQ